MELKGLPGVDLERQMGVHEVELLVGVRVCACVLWGGCKQKQLHE